MTESTALEPQKTLEEKLEDSIRESIGDLLSSEDLRKIVEHGLNKIFFEKRIEKDSYGRSISTEAPFIYGLLQELLQDTIKELTREWLIANESVIRGEITKVIEQGAGISLLKVIDSIFSDSMNNMEGNMFSKLRSLHQ